MPPQVISDDQILLAKPGPQPPKLKPGLGLFLPLALAQVCVGHPTSHFHRVRAVGLMSRSALRIWMPPGVDPFFSPT